MLTRWNPWLDLLDAQRETQDLLRRAFGTWSAPQVATSWAPAMDVFSREGDLVVRADLPGIDPEKDVDITVQDGVLTISGERRSETKTNGDDWYRVESSYGSFRRGVPVPEGVKPEDITASYKDGILEVVVPKAMELAAPKRIPITAGEPRKALTTKGSRK